MPSDRENETLMAIFSRAETISLLAVWLNQLTHKTWFENIFSVESESDADARPSLGQRKRKWPEMCVG